ncbi:MAG TPA: hypothetical protein O0X70_01015 [Methanocorpusculum sp.]|nr:hypothetical protein [Methanocorpusculum sp.]
MTEAFTTCVILEGDEAKEFRRTMIDSMPAEQTMSREEYAKMKDIAKELGFDGIL